MLYTGLQEVELKPTSYCGQDGKAKGKFSVHIINIFLLLIPLPFLKDADTSKIFYSFIY